MPNVVGPGAHEANGALRVAELDGMVIPRAQTVPQDECGHAHGVEPGRDLPSFVVHRQGAVAAARRDDDAGARSDASGGIHGERGPVGVRVAQRARRAVLPEGHLDRRHVERRRRGR